jgi:hypothetical protein
VIGASTPFGEGAGDRYRTYFGRLRTPYPTGVCKMKTRVYRGE